MLTGRPPFRASHVDTLLLVMHEDPVPLRQVNPVLPRDLEVICQKCMEKNPTDRYLTAIEFAGDLQRYLAEEPNLAWRSLLAGFVLLALLIMFCCSSFGF